MSFFHRLNHVQLCLLVLVATGAAGCDLPFGVGATEDASAPPMITELPRALTAGEVEVVHTSNAFGLDLLQELVEAEPERSHFFSPLSAAMALGMALNGMEGETWEAIRQTLRVPEELSEAEINQSFGGLLDVLDGLDPQVSFDLTNSVWYRHDRSLRASFEASMRGPFRAHVEQVDFEAEETAVQMNDWIAENTRGRIGEVIENPIREAEIRLFYLVNTGYFEGDWTDRFDPSRTALGDFHGEDGSVSQVRFMEAEGGFRFGSHARGDYRAADKPYGGQAFSMTVIVPNERFTLQDVVADLARGGWEALTERWDELDEGGLGLERRGVLALPRFTLDWEKDLERPLTAMGMGIAFGVPACGAWEFSRFFADWVPFCAILDDVRQATFLRVDERGTEAATSTVVGGIPLSTPPTVRADRPFVLAIRERLSGAILFLGVVVEPPVDG